MINETLMDLRTYEPRNKIKQGIGIACLIIAIAPNGLGPVFYPLSFMLLGITMKDLKLKLYDFKIKLKYGLR
jgi:hypothetical protein